MATKSSMTVKPGRGLHRDGVSLGALMRLGGGRASKVAKATRPEGPDGQTASVSGIGFNGLGRDG